ncbi:MAG TPA: CocE/NonD family hydrolase, partial [Polyangia bacterium]|nr:CocE/NonD family hydrolase [Polyangia bacterium]
MRRQPLVFVLAALSFAACSDGNARFTVRESVEQLQVTHAEPGAMLGVFDATGAMTQSGTTDVMGSLMFRHVAPASGYTVRTLSGARETSRHLTVKSVSGSLPQQSFYSGQKLVPGFQYIRTRDGTTLSAYVTLPGPIDMGPYPTVVDYSGYDPSKPGQPIAGTSYLCDQFPSLCDAPNDPGGLLASLFGYATVSVNIRGTGCSGGAYDFFETLQLLDGYDVIETVAAQPWVLHHKVGMVGLSYPGITQLFVASTRPPSLASIAPLSVIGNAQTTVLPGGMLNDGFALTWVTEVLSKADPYGQGWEMARVQGGDTVCAENQLLHAQKIDNVAMARNTMYYDPAIDDQYNPTTFVDQINVPVFFAGAWQDEQTGPFFTTLLDRFTGAPALRINVYNGVHPDGFAPQILGEWYAFLELFVAERVPIDPSAFRDVSPVL